LRLKSTIKLSEEQFEGSKYYSVIVAGKERSSERGLYTLMNWPITPVGRTIYQSESKKINLNFRKSNIRKV